VHKRRSTLVATHRENPLALKKEYTTNLKDYEANDTTYGLKKKITITSTTQRNAFKYQIESDLSKFKK
jgi:hypothetical protein